MNGKGDNSSGSGEHSERVNNSLPSMSFSNEIPHNSEFDLRKLFADEWPDKQLRSKLTRGEDLRTDLYYLLADSTSLKKHCKDLLTQSTNYMQKKMFSINCTSMDMLCLLAFGKGADLSKQPQKMDLPQICCEKMSVPLFPELRLTNNNNSKGNKHRKRNSIAPLEPAQMIGRQHIVICSVPDTISSGGTSSTSSDSAELLEEPLQKKSKKEIKEERKKICQRAKKISVTSHLNNFVRDPDVYCQVDILILIDTTLEGIGLKVSNHLGLIFVEDLLGNVMPNSDSLVNPDAKFFKLLQTLIAEKLMIGFNNIVVTNTAAIWMNICANVRGIIIDTASRVDTQHADFVIVLQNDSQEHVILSCIEGISEIINKSIGFKVSLPVNYELPDKAVCPVNLPIISFIPLYVVRYFTQLRMSEMPNDKDNNLDTLFI